eukprot:TRINITY_DN5304_c0_g1_i3.p1 TRINITY_DN5304_c0_g1~~TRINITY_DN5304_c0_g1_i3.p1  ORF type:complete len:802 (+),score=131.92 TRINITY_DN5304_c0_g1_i3:47-2452(+)
MRSVRREIGRYPGRFVVLLGLVYAMFFVMHSKMLSLPEGRVGGVHELLGERAEKAEKTVETVEKMVKPTPTEKAKEDAKPGDKITTRLGDTEYSIRHYGHGIYHVMTGEERRCKFHENVVVGDLNLQPVGKTDPRLKLTEQSGNAVFEQDFIKVTVDPAKSTTKVEMKAKVMTGLPERTSGLVLEDGKYELWNLDVFKYKLDDKAPLYGVVPIVIGISEGESAGFLWLNPARSHVTVSERNVAEWSAEENCMQFVVYPGPNPADVLRQHSFVTGKPFLPPVFSLGYHQCRWNYKDEADVAYVSQHFKDNMMPVDAIWLDIEHTDRKHYFTWDKRLFPKPLEMQAKLQKDGRKLVTISDPHISRSKGYYVHDEAQSNGYYVKDKNGGDYHGHCWPGDSSWVDFLNPKARDWYQGLFSLDKYKGSTEDLHTWIDMNEPSVFSGPRTTMHDDAVHYDGSKHVEVHNMYGHLHAKATHDGLIGRSKSARRGFVLSRSFFAGTQRYAAIWTGDNQASWAHLKASVDMLLGLGMGGIPFVGADVGGFFGETTPDLMVRWFQLGAFYPFYRGHSHHENSRKEPYLTPEQTHRPHIAAALHLRYSLIPYLYTVFWNATVEGLPVLRPVFLEFPGEGVTSHGRTFMVGDSILAAPILEAKVAEHKVRLPGEGVWYEYGTGRRVDGGRDDVFTDVGLGTLPVYLRGGKVVVVKEEDKGIRSTVDLEKVGYRLVVGIDPRTQSSEGKVYLDDGATTTYQTGLYNFKSITFASRTLNISCAHSTPYSPLAAFPPYDVPYTPSTANITSIACTG